MENTGLALSTKSVLVSQSGVITPAAVSVDVKIVDGKGESQVSASTSLDKTSTKKSKSVTLTVPAGLRGQVRRGGGRAHERYGVGRPIRKRFSCRAIPSVWRSGS
ncbi:hypothetical protein Daud_1915 [Candidatus Desulforudis audaxviator MP104C]|uniref:Uncharacterized protein n=1 Tax=Desulforudis audaxviator (strain MP104C) TaxID=477974 RepID=B1I627_DESAP|nr:hypothetical protein Daud_1915 [Candidatus Desulforudis audaxviator MP104C]